MLCLLQWATLALSGMSAGLDMPLQPKTVEITHGSQEAYAGFREAEGLQVAKFRDVAQ